MQRIITTTIVISAVAVLTTAAAGAAHAEPLTYRPAPPTAGAASIHVDLPYTFGTHNFEVGVPQGDLRVEWGDTPVVSGRLSVPLAALRGGGDTLNCHMREAMGLDYSKSSFPGSHVCSGGQLPASGKDAVAFPEITFEIKRVAAIGARTRGSDGDTWLVAASGRWTIHGVTRNDTIDLRLTVPTNDAVHPRTIRVEGIRKIRLADYGIQVKRAFVVTAGEEATMKLDFLLTARS